MTTPDQTAPVDLTPEELAAQLRCTPQNINFLRRQIQMRTGKAVGYRLGKGIKLTPEDQDLIRQEKALGTAAAHQREQVKQAATAENINYAQSQGGNALNQVRKTLTTKADQVATELAVQTQIAIIAGTAAKLAAVEDPRIDHALNAFESMFDNAIEGAQEISGNVLCGFHPPYLEVSVVN